MARQHGSLPESAQAAQRLQVVAEAAVFVVDDGGAAAQDGVGGQHRVVEQERHRVGGVARRGHHRDVQARRIDDLTVGERAAEAAQEPAADRADHRAGELDDLVDAAGVVLVLVADQHQRDLAELGDPRDVLVVVGPGVDDHHLVAARAAQHPGVGAVQRHQPGVVAQQYRRGFGDRPQQPVRGMLERHDNLCLHRRSRDLDDELDFHRRVERQLGHPDRRARVRACVAEHLAEQFARPR